MPTRRALLAAAAGGAGALPPARPAALAQPAWPSRPVSMIVPFVPGGLPDSNARFVAGRLYPLPDLKASTSSTIFVAAM